MKQKRSHSFSRNLRVGEELRHALSDLLIRGEVHEYAATTPITVSEVRVSPDLRHATAFVFPLAGKNKDQVMQGLRAATYAFRKHLADKVELQFMPQLRFELDASFEQADKIEKILAKDKNRAKADSDA